jgi:hypothetical protein
MKELKFTENQIFQNKLFMGRGSFVLLPIKPSKLTVSQKTFKFKFFSEKKRRLQIPYI